MNTLLVKELQSINKNRNSIFRSEDLVFLGNMLKGEVNSETVSIRQKFAWNKGPFL